MKKVKNKDSKLQKRIKKARLSPASKPKNQKVVRLPKHAVLLTTPFNVPVLKGKEAKAFLEDIAKPPAELQKKIVEEAVERFHVNTSPLLKIPFGGPVKEETSAFISTSGLEEEKNHEHDFQIIGKWNHNERLLTKCVCGAIRFE